MDYLYILIIKPLKKDKLVILQRRHLNIAAEIDIVWHPQKSGNTKDDSYINGNFRRNTTINSTI